MNFPPAVNPPLDRILKANNDPPLTILQRLMAIGVIRN